MKNVSTIAVAALLRIVLDAEGDKPAKEIAAAALRDVEAMEDVVLAAEEPWKQD